VLGQLTGGDEADGRLDLARGQGGLLGVAGQLAGLSGEAVEDVADEGVQDGNRAHLFGSARQTKRRAANDERAGERRTRWR